MAGGPAARRTAVIEISHPGYVTMSGEIGYPEGDTPMTLDDLAIQTHELVNDIIMAIRKKGPQ